MAGNHHPKGIFAIGSRYCPNCINIAHPFRQFEVAAGFPEGDFKQFLPNFLLKFAAFRIEF